MQNHVSPFFDLQARSADLKLLGDVAERAWQDQSLPSLQSIPASAQETALLTISVATLLLLLALRSGR
jgi:hypothetical protein